MTDSPGLQRLSAGRKTAGMEKSKFTSSLFTQPIGHYYTKNNHTNTHTLGEIIVTCLFDQDIGSGLCGERTGTADDVMKSVGNANQRGYPSRHDT